VAKGKSAKKSKAKSDAESKRKAPALQASRRLSSEDEPAGTKEFSGIGIGHVAGEVWGILSNGAPKTLAEIKKSVAAPPEVVIAAIGWLAREDKLDYSSSGRTVKISLR
jgi:hypothetical protein